MSLADHEDDRPCAAEGCQLDTSRGQKYCGDHTRARSGDYPDLLADTTLDYLGPVLADD